MMEKTLIYPAAFALVITTGLYFPSYAIAQTDNGRDANVNNDLQFPTERWRIVKHTFRLHIPKNINALSQLIIDTPPAISVSNDIKVLEQNGQKVDINVSSNGRRIIIYFPEKVISNTKLNISFNKVKQPTLGPASVYRFSAKLVGSDAEIPVAVAQFRTF